MKILFIGNSFTFYNNMPGLFERIAFDEGENLKADKVAFGGYCLSQYADPASGDGRFLEGKLRGESWDYVVIQGQSAEPALNRADFLTAAVKLCQRIRAAGARPVFFQSWSYSDGSEKLASTGLDYHEMHRALKEGYSEAALKNDAGLVAVGDLFYRLNKPLGEHYMICSDSYHPTALGSYAAAVCFFRYFFGAGKGEHWRHYAIKEEAAAKVREAARELIKR